MKKRILSVLCVIVMLVASFSGVVCASDGSENTRMTEREEEAKEEAYKQLSIFRETLSPDNDFYYPDFDNLEIADPFIIYIANQDAQDEVYYFPVYDHKTNKVIYVINAFSVDQRTDFICEFSLAYNSVLDKCAYINDTNDVIAYRLGYSVYFETSNAIYDDAGKSAVLNSSCSDKESLFINMSFDEKKTAVQDRINDMAPFSTPELSAEEMLYAKMQGYLTLYNPQYQYGYGMCWACAVATTCNYINSTSITGFSVCNAMGIGYNSGGTILDEKDALSYYGVVYNCMRYTNTSGGLSPITYSCIKNNIDNYCPVILNGSSSGSNHAVTLRGYNGNSNASYNLMYFDSSYSNILAAQKNCTYNNFYFESQGSIYYFISTLSKYW